MPHVLAVTCDRQITPARSLAVIYSTAIRTSPGRSALGTLALLHGALHSPVEVPLPVSEEDIQELVDHNVIEILSTSNAGIMVKLLRI